MGLGGGWFCSLFTSRMPFVRIFIFMIFVYPSLSLYWNIMHVTYKGHAQAASYILPSVYNLLTNLLYLFQYSGNIVSLKVEKHFLDFGTAHPRYLGHTPSPPLSQSSGSATAICLIHSHDNLLESLQHYCIIITYNLYSTPNSALEWEFAPYTVWFIYPKLLYGLNAYTCVYIFLCHR